MNSSQQIADLIGILVKKNKEFSVSKMLTEIGLGKNVMSHLDNGSMIKAGSLREIADYLDVSVDYLFGRTNKPQINRTVTNNHIIEAENRLVGGSITIKNGITRGESSDSDELTSEMNRLFSALTVQEKISLIQSLYEKDKK